MKENEYGSLRNRPGRDSNYCYYGAIYPGAHLSASAIISKIIKNQTSDSTIFNKTAYLGLPNNPRLTALSVEMN